MDSLEITTASDSSVLVVLAEAPSEATGQRVAVLTAKLLQLRNANIRNVHPAYVSVLIDFDPLLTTPHEISSLVRSLELDDQTSSAAAPRMLQIPVCYAYDLGLDLQDVAKELGIAAEELVRRHTAGTYNVSFFGFSPGFAYLGGLHESLHVARLESPRRLVSAGSVAIAGKQTGVYSVDSPGGWRILGKTPWRMFDPDSDPPTPLLIGDHVNFVSINREEFDHLAQERTR